MKDAINGSDTVLEYTDTGGQYANVRFDAPSNFDLVGGGSKFTLKIYVDSASLPAGGVAPNQLSVKLQDGTANEPWAEQSEIIKPIVLDVWQELTYDFEADVDRTDFNRVVIQVNGENNFEAVTAYIDDLVYSN